MDLERELTREITDFEVARKTPWMPSRRSRCVEARVASGLSQRDLAERLGLKEQQIQRYEATEYASASLRRIREVVGALGVDLAGQITCAPARPWRRRAPDTALRKARGSRSIPKSKRADRQMFPAR